MAESLAANQVINVHQAKTHLSRLIARVEAGEEVVIARAGRPVAKLVPFQTKRWEDVFGALAHLGPVPDDFNDPDPEIEAMFGLR